MARDLDVQLKISALVEGNRSLASVSSRLKTIGKQVENVGAKFKRLGSSLTLGLTTPLVGIAGLAIKSAAELETLTVAFEGLTGSAEKAGEVVNDLRKFAANTPFQFEQIGGAGRALLAFGVEADDVVNKLTTLGNIAAGSNSDLESLAQIYGKVLSAGKLTGETLLQFAERGIPLNRELASTLGVQESAIKDLVSKGKIGLDELNATFANLTNGSGLFAGAIEKQSQTIAGVYSTLKDNVAQALSDLGNTIVSSFDLRGIIASTTEFVQQVRDRFNDLSESGRRLIIVVGSLTATIGPALLIFGTILTTVNPLVVGIGLLVGGLGLLLERFDLLTPTLSAIRTGFNALLGTVLGFNDVVADAIGNVVSFTTEQLSNLLSTLGLFVTRVGSLTNSDSLVTLGLQLSDTADNIRDFSQSLSEAISGDNTIKVEVDVELPDAEEVNKKISTALQGGPKPKGPSLDISEGLEDITEADLEVREKLTETGQILTNNFSNAFTDIATGTKGVASAFDDLAQSIIRSLTQRALTSAIGSIVGSLGGSTSTTSVASPQAFASGGEVRGPGTGTSDSILARLSNGEFVSDAKTVRHFGSDFFKRLKKMARGNTPAFATGGLVNMANGLQNHINSAPLPKFRDGGLVNTGQTGVQMPNVNISINNNGSTSQVVDQNTSFDGRDLFIELFLEDMQNNGKVSQALQGTFGLNR